MVTNRSTRAAYSIAWTLEQVSVSPAQEHPTAPPLCSPPFRPCLVLSFPRHDWQTACKHLSSSPGCSPFLNERVQRTNHTWKTNVLRIRVSRWKWCRRPSSACSKLTFPLFPPRLHFARWSRISRKKCTSLSFSERSLF